MGLEEAVRFGGGHEDGALLRELVPLGEETQESLLPLCSPPPLEIYISREKTTEKPEYRGLLQQR